MSVPSTNPVNGPVFSSASSAHTLQAYIELFYVRAGNELLTNKLEQLQESIGVTQQAIKSLTTLQNLHNMISVNAKSAFNFNFASSHGGTAAKYGSAYRTAASAYFGQNIGVRVAFNTLYPNLSAMQTKLRSVGATLSQQITTLSALTAASANDPNSLLATLKVVLNDIKRNSAHISAWLIDNYNNSTGTAALSSGIIQSNLNNAMTAAQSLNTNQAQSVRSYLLLFEEFYKSATAALRAITQIIQRMAQNISR